MSANGNELFKEGDFLNLRHEGEWRRLLISDAVASRTVKASDDTVAVVTSVSDDGDVNTFTVGVNSANMSGGTGATQNNAACYSFELKKSDGTAYKMDEQFTMDIFVEWTSTPGATDNNTCFFGVVLTNGPGVNFSYDDGSGDDTGYFGPQVIWNNSVGPRVGTSSQGGGLNTGGTNVDMTYFRASFHTTSATETTPLYGLMTEVYDSSGVVLNRTKFVNGASHWGGGTGTYSRPTGDVHLCFVIGRVATKVSTSTFSFRVFYRITPVATYQGVETGRPGA